MISPELEKALESREVLRLQDGGVDVRLYDTDQILILGTKRIDGETRREGNRRITEEVELPVTVRYDLRTNIGNYYVEGEGGGSNVRNAKCFHNGVRLLEANGVDLHKWEVADDRGNDPKRYPELAEFVNDLHDAFTDRKWERHELAIKGFLPTLKGHGNISPWALLNPLVIAAYVKGTIFPFERKDVFDFEKGRKKLESKDEYMLTEESVSYDGNAVLIRPWYLSREDEKYNHTVIEAHFFNPANYQRFLNGELKVENVLPSRKDWKFEVTYGIELGKKWLHFSADRFDYQHVQKEGLLAKKKNDIFLKADERLVATIEKIAPLPL